MIPYVRQFDFTYGRRDQVSPLIQRVIADNPGRWLISSTVLERFDLGLWTWFEVT